MTLTGSGNHTFDPEPEKKKTEGQPEGRPEERPERRRMIRDFDDSVNDLWTLFGTEVKSSESPTMPARIPERRYYGYCPYHSTHVKAERVLRMVTRFLPLYLDNVSISTTVWINFFPSHFLCVTLLHSSVFLEGSLNLFAGLLVDLPLFRLCWKVT